MKIHEQITFLRKQKGITQEELAQVLCVTNQSVSKWEAGICCPDIQLLPELAKYFNVSVDELLGYKPPESFWDICLKIKTLFQTADKDDCFDMAYKFSYFITGGCLSKYTTDNWPWGVDMPQDDEYFYKMGYGTLHDVQGSYCVKQNSVFITSNKRHRPMTNQEFRELYSFMNMLSDKTALKVLFALFNLTANDFDRWATIEEIADSCGLPVNDVDAALDKLPIQIGPNNTGYRIEGSYMYVPPLLIMMTHGRI